MSELRNRFTSDLQNVPNGHSNGFIPSDINLYKKKLLMLEDEVSFDQSSNNNNSYSLPNDEDHFADTQTVPGCSSHAKILDQDPVIVTHEGFSIGQSARDQFAIALLKLQRDLDLASRRLSEIENKLEARNRQQKSKAPAITNQGFFNRDNVTNLVYFSWPVLVFLAMRAIEKRSLSSKLA